MKKRAPKGTYTRRNTGVGDDDAKWREVARSGAKWREIDFGAAQFSEEDQVRANDIRALISTKNLVGARSPNKVYSKLYAAHIYFLWSAEICYYDKCKQNAKHSIAIKTTGYDMQQYYWLPKCGRILPTTGKTFSAEHKIAIV